MLVGSVVDLHLLLKDFEPYAIIFVNVCFYNRFRGMMIICYYRIDFMGYDNSGVAMVLL
jgi:hypothetical protein